MSGTHADSPHFVDPSGMQETSFVTRGDSRARDAFYILRDWHRPINQAGATIKPWCSRRGSIFGSRRRLLGVSLLEFRKRAQASRQNARRVPFPFPSPPHPSPLLPQLLHLRRTMEHVRHCDISERRLQRHWRVSYGGCGSPRDTWCLSRVRLTLLGKILLAGIRSRGLIGPLR